MKDTRQRVALNGFLAKVDHHWRSYTQSRKGEATTEGQGLKYGALVAFCLFGAIAFRGDFSMAYEMIPVVEFRSPERGLRWQIVNDGVMGGLSQSQMVLTTSRTGVFQGTVSLENNGGFASVRTEAMDLGLGGYKGLTLRVKGDGKRYQLRLRTDRRFDGVAYKTSFDTVAGEWITIRADFREFSPTFRGRLVPGAPTLDPASIRQIGFLISDYQEGRFRLEIDAIKAYR